MTTPTINVLALDAADYELCKKWDCDNILMNNHQPLETFTYTFENHPFTPEVWASVATGVHPRDHEVSGDARYWDNPLLRLGSKLTRHFPHPVRRQLGRPFRERGMDQSFDQVDHPTPFDALWTWPGVTEAENLERAWRLKDDLKEGEITVGDLRRGLRENTYRELGWLRVWDAFNDGGCVGVHSHILDSFGHLYCERPEELRDEYEWMDGIIGWLKEQISGELVVLSDHGMRISSVDDDAFGRHSMRALVASTIGDNLPNTVFEVANWLDERRSPIPDEFDMDTGEDAIDTPVEHLRQLGYVE